MTSDRRWWALTCIAVAQLMIALDATVVNIALPSVQISLQFSDADRQWIVAAYTLAFGGLLLLGGRIADSRLGRKRSFLIGLCGFAGASALSGAAPSLGMLIAARALQGACAALLAPTALSLLALTFTQPADRARAFGIYGAIAASGGAVGLLLGGALTEYLDWRWCLYVNVPIALMAAVGARSLLSSAPQAEADARFDLPGLALGSGGLVALVYALGQVPARGLSSPFVLALLAGGALALALFVTREAHTPAPLLPLRIVLDRQRGPAYVCAGLAIAGMFGAFLFLSYELQAVLRFSPLEAGLAFLPMSLSTLVLATLIAPRLLPRVAPALLLVPGFLLSAAGMLILAQVHTDTAYPTGILPAEVLLGFGTSSVMVTAASLATSRVQQRDAGIASAVLNSAQQIGASVGIAVLNTVAASVTNAYLASNPQAPGPDAMVHGYAAAALCGAGILLLGAAVAASTGISRRALPRQRSPRSVARQAPAE
jgi:EmrB/QacA subfamily drug resistance transporter